MTSKEWASLRRGFQEMQYRYATNELDPTGYIYQANIHGWPGYNNTIESKKMAEKLNWHNCQHGQYFFLPWHRMYLYYFEKILRSAANDPYLTIPYWDYFDPQERVIPEPFRIPSDSKLNPLYVSERCSEMNHGRPLPTEIVNHDPALSSPFFTVNKYASAQHVCHSFGGAKADEPMFDSDGHGVLEQMPHNQIHLFIGGSKGFMSDNCKASRDPIFWLHHAQIDRIWETWLKMGGENINEDKWMNQNFSWFDENGHRQDIKVEDVMDTVNQLNYKYDKLAKTNEKNDQKMTTIPTPTIISDRENLRVNNIQRSLFLSLDKEAIELFKDLLNDINDNSKIRFSIQLSIKYIMRGIIFDMYINLPNQTYPYESAPYFVRPIVVLQPDCDNIPEEGKNLNIKNCFDVTSNLKSIIKHETNFGINTITSGILNLTFVPKSCGQIIHDDVKGDWIIFNRIQLVYFVPEYQKSSGFYFAFSVWFVIIFISRVIFY